ncbi:MAG: CDP-diacylglycerol--serine O-phosphatidyltransferase [Candidatus Tectimicrobiota bacterium]|nr:MAG: CDP-diacylglycerol--serine O-phosphatidyltransferase [Candidatus Tectomicrobia bacterium]
MKRGMYLLPNLFTTGNLLCGFSSVIAALNGQYTQAALAILVAVVLDCLDGKVARMTNSASAFGLEYDSLADLLSFGVAPGLLLYTWILQPFGHFGWLAAFLFVICGALRLARFNVQATSLQRYVFIGLPIPAAAGVIASAVLLSERLTHDAHVAEIERSLFLVLAVYVLALLMVSNIKYRSLKYLRLRRPFPLPLLVGAVLALPIALLVPEFFLFLLFLGYALSGPVESLLRRKKPEEEALPAEH